MMQWGKITGVLFAILSSATFGLIPLFSIPLLDRGIGSESILCYRFLLASIAMALIMLFTRRSFKLNFSQVGVIVALSILYASTAILLIESYKYIPSGVATTIHFLYPLVVIVAMVWLFNERTTVVTYIAIIVSLLGVALLTWGSHSEGDYKRGVIYALLTAVTYAAYIVGVKNSRASRVDSIVLTFYVLAIGTILFFVYALATTGIESIHTLSSWRDLIILALVCTILSDYTLIMAIKLIGSTMTSILGSMEPMTAIVIGVLYFGEVFDATTLTGVILIIIAVILVITQTNRSGVT